MKGKMVLKIILIIFTILVLGLLIFIFTKFAIIRGLLEKAENISSNNYHIEKTTEMKGGDVHFYNYYKKDGKSLFTIQVNNQAKYSYYYNGERTNLYYEEDGKLIVEPTIELSESSEFFKMDFTNAYFGTNSNFELLVFSLKADIKSENYNGKDCYVISFIHDSLKDETYIEKETGLCLKRVIYELDTENSILKDGMPNLEAWKYEFDNVSDDILKEPVE